MPNLVKIRMKTTSAGPDGVMIEGQTYDIDIKEADALVNGRYAEFVQDSFINEQNLSENVQRENNDAPLALILDQKAEDVIKSITGEIPEDELSELLQLEFEGKQRKTVIEHIQKLLDNPKE